MRQDGHCPHSPIPASTPPVLVVIKAVLRDRPFCRHPAVEYFPPSQLVLSPLRCSGLVQFLRSALLSLEPVVEAIEETVFHIRCSFKFSVSLLQSDQELHSPGFVLSVRAPKDVVAVFYSSAVLWARCYYCRVVAAPNGVCWQNVMDEFSHVSSTHPVMVHHFYMSYPVYLFIMLVSPAVPFLNCVG